MKKILAVTGALLFLVMLVACNNNETNNGNDSTEGIDTVTFSVEIMEIHDGPDPEGVLGYHTVLARSIDGPITGYVSFEHLDLTDIGATVGDTVEITVYSPWLEPYPIIPLWVSSWSLVE